MCGIAVIVSAATLPPLPVWPFWRGSSPPPDTSSSPADVALAQLLTDLLPSLRRRGPDAAFVSASTLAPDTQLVTLATSLLLRGPPPTCSGAALPDNDDHAAAAAAIVAAAAQADGDGSLPILLFNGEIFSASDDGLLAALSAGSDTAALYARLLPLTADPPALLRLLDSLEGPWALILWCPVTRRLFVARDALGRRSLLIRHGRDDAAHSHRLVVTSVPPHAPRAAAHFAELPPLGLAFVEFAHDGSAEWHLVARATRPVPPLRAPQPRLPDSLIAGTPPDMYVSFLPPRWLRSVDCSRALSPPPPLPPPPAAAVTLFVHHLTASVRLRLQTSLPRASHARARARFALLFSGGLDSTVLARVLHDCLSHDEPLDLINVAFGDDRAATSACPDRRTAILACRELRALCAGRSFRLILADVTAAEADAVLDTHVRPLVAPCDRPMDATIGAALWLAARGRGRLYTDGDADDDADGEETTADELKTETSAKILFSGLGADELLAGYKGRHRTAFRTGGAAAVAREIDADLSRLWLRNLGRDDRLAADHGRELRHPFLDGQLIAFITALPLTPHVCDLAQPDGVGDKRLLRQAAAALGLSQDTVSRAKRAIQFGSRSKHVLERKIRS